jgi:hypothetical protein
MLAEWTLERDLKIEVDCAAWSGLWDATWKLKSTLDCRTERTLDATTVVDFVPRGVDFKMQKMKALPEGKIEWKIEKMSSFAARAGLGMTVEVDLRLRLQKSTCATGVGLGATVSVDLCHGSGLRYDC